MAKDMSETVRDALSHAVKEAVKNAGNASPKPKRNGGGPLSGAKGLAAGAGLAAAAPLAKKGVTAIRNGGLPSMSPTNVASKAGDKVGAKVKPRNAATLDSGLPAPPGGAPPAVALANPASAASLVGNGLVGLDQMSDAAADATITLAQSTAMLNGKHAKGNVNTDEKIAEQAAR